MSPKKSKKSQSKQCCRNAERINYLPVLDHWNNECRQADDASRDSDFKFISKPGSSGPDSSEPMLSVPGPSESGSSEPGTSEPRASEPGTSKQDSITAIKCTRCGKEWDIEDLEMQESYTTPMFCCLQVSDTGTFMSWKKVKYPKPDGLQPGDHVAWLRCLGYWHHAIVEKVNEDGSIEVLEWSWTKIHRSTKSKCDVRGNCCWSPMYKAYYPNYVEAKNPSNLVLLRANYREGHKGYSLCNDNCEHFARFSKTGEHKCNQICQCWLSLGGCVVRLFIRIFLLSLAVSISEVVESAKDPPREFIGAIILFVLELIYVAVFSVLTFSFDTRQEQFKRDEKCSWSTTPACRCAMCKTVLQTVLAFGMSLLFGIWLVKTLTFYETLNERNFSDRWKMAGWEICFGILGFIFGNILGFYLFSYFPWSCCCSRQAAERQDQINTVV